MKELMSKGFWRGVVKTFYEGMEAPPEKPAQPQASAVKPAAPQPSDEATPTAKETPHRPAD